MEKRMAIKEDSFKVAGLYYYQEDFLKKHNFDIDNDDYEFDSSSVELIPEPENKHDPNAIKVIVNGIQVGYVPKEITSFVRELINSPDFESMKILIVGTKNGESYDDNDNVTEDIDLSATVFIYTRTESDDEKPKRTNPLYFKIELVCGIVITLCSLITYKIFAILGLFFIVYSLYQLNKRKNDET